MCFSRKKNRYCKDDVLTIDDIDILDNEIYDEEDFDDDFDDISNSVDDF